MTLFYFGNCCALACTPNYFAYKYSKLPEYGMFWKCVQAGVVYLLTQLCKMLFLATFFPATEPLHSGQIDIFGEIFKSAVDVADLVGIHIVMSKVPGAGDLKILVAGIGWASAELVMTRFLPLWVGARGLEFDWKYVQMSLESNLNLIHHVVMATLIWLWSRKYLKKSLFSVVVSLLMAGCFKPLVIEIMASVLHLGSWTVLALKTTVTAFLGLITLQLYINFVPY